MRFAIVLNSDYATFEHPHGEQPLLYEDNFSPKLRNPIFLEADGDLAVVLVVPLAILVQTSTVFVPTEI
jgi:hypothetical protein